MNEDKIVDILLIGAVLTVIILKIVGVIKISWLWLLSPIWILTGLGVVLAVFVTVLCLIQNYINKKEN